MKKSLLLSLCAWLALTQLGFDWGGKPSDQKKSTAQSVVNSNAQYLSFPQIMEALTQNMTLWPTLSQDDKNKAVGASMMIFRERQNAAILRPIEFYVNQLDTGIKANPAMQGADILTLLKMMSVMEYDFYNGQNKDELAKQVLGESLAESIRGKK